MKKGSKTTNTVETDPRAQRVQNWLYNNAKNADFESYDGPRVAGADTATMQALKDQYAKGMTGFGQGFDMLSGMAGQVPDASQFQNPFQQQVIDAANQGYDASQAQAFNQLDRNAAGKGGFRNARLDLGYGAAAGDIANERGQFMGNMQYQGYMDSMNRARQQQQDQIGLGQGLLNTGMASAQSQQGLQEYLRNLRQQGLDANYEEFMREQQQPYLQAGLMSGALAGPWGSKQTSEEEKGWMDNIVGMGSQLAGALIPGVGMAKGLLGSGAGPMQTLGTGMNGIPQASVPTFNPMNFTSPWMPQNPTWNPATRTMQ